MIRDLMYGFLALAVVSFSIPAEASECTELGNLFKNIDTSRAVELQANGSGGRTYKQLYDECDKTNTFNQKPLPAKRKCSTDPNLVKGVWKFPDGTVVVIAKGAVDADGSPLAQSATGTNQPETSLKWDDTGKSADAEAVSFIVVPLPRAGVSFSDDSSIVVGDLDVVIRADNCSAGLVADKGPGFRLGEGSLRMHEDLGNPQCAVANQVPCKRLVGGNSGRGLRSVSYIVFPGSKPHPMNVGNIADYQRAAAAKAKEFLLRFQRVP